MSTVLEQKPPTIPQRTAEAARQAAEALGVDDLKRLAAALAEAAAEGVRRNPAFASHVRTLYDSMAPKRPEPKPRASTSSGRKSSTKRVAPDVELVPLKEIEGVLNPAAAPDPYFLLELYGPKQLPIALGRYTLPRLKEAVESVQKRYPGTRPKNMRNANSIITYIVEHVAGATS